MPTKLPFLPDEHQFAIALVAVTAAELDMTIEKLVYLMFGQPDSITEFILKNLHANRIMDFLLTLFLARLPNYEGYLNELFARIKTSRQDRNDLLHWLYDTSHKGDTIKIEDKRPFRHKPPREMTAGDIQVIADSLENCVDELVEWMILHDWVHGHPLSDKPEQQPRPPNWALPSKIRPPNT